MARRIVAALVLAGALGAGTARAADSMVLDCLVHANHPDHGVSDWTRRLMLDRRSRTVTILDNFGHGFVQRDRYPFVSVNLRRITLEEHGGKVAYVDRTSGQYVLRNPERHFELQGHCTRGGGV
jgi:hypothetical protein